ncbi:lamin tail domain-containing protein [Patescibacteria group bacterium]|nr:lamin tail domain-containing protein [Patescibacteria group bacterium]
MIKKTTAKKPGQAKGKTSARTRTRKRVNKNVSCDVCKVKPVKRKIAKKDKSGQIIKKSIGKLTVLFLIISLNWSGLAAIGETLAYFNDTETFLESTYSAGTLDFSLNQFNGFSPDVTPSQSASSTIELVNNGNLAFQYEASTSTISGDLDLCKELYLEVFLELEQIYTGNLSGLSLASSSLTVASSTTQSLDFIVSLVSSTSSLQDKTCNFDFEFRAWQKDQPSYDPKAGFSDAEIISNTVTSGNWEYIVINKVYYDVDDAHGDDPANEWVELYNPTDSSVDISGWKILDNHSEDLIPTSTSSIPALGYAIITGASSTFDYWDIPDQAVKIVLADGKIGNGLGNDNDMLILLDDAGNIVDQMNWGTPINGWPNYNSNLWDPGAAKVAEGNLLSREPNGYDTDQASDWTEFSLPSVTVIIPNGGEVWYVGATSTIDWQATNNNGDDNDLSIDIYYSADSGNTWGNIATSTENDGTYDWRVSLCLDDGSGSCYWVPSAKARIKIVATDYTKNFMLTAWDESDEDFCPPILYDSLTDEELELLEKMGLLPDDFINQEATDSDELIPETSEESEEDGEEIEKQRNKETKDANIANNGESEVEEPEMAEEDEDEAEFDEEEDDDLGGAVEESDNKEVEANDEPELELIENNQTDITEANALSTEDVIKGDDAEDSDNQIEEGDEIDAQDEIKTDELDEPDESGELEQAKEPEKPEELEGSEEPEPVDASKDIINENDDDIV